MTEIVKQTSIQRSEGMLSVKDEGYSTEVLRRSTVLPHLDALDARDVVECYALTRMAKLENVATSSAGHLIVRKMAIAFRYKPKSSSPDAVVKEPFELTLEYGPSRTGSSMTLEAMPNISGEMDIDLESSDKYMTWENDAKIYYGLSIPEDEWDNAYYMAPLTGAVLSNILNGYILDYPLRHPRYQPVRIVDKTTRALVLNSSNSDDFVWNVFQKLSDMYVPIDPILVPPRYALNLYVDDVGRDVEKIESDAVIYTDAISEDGKPKEEIVANAAANFYAKFYSCVDAIKSGDYSAFEHASTTIPTPAPTSLQKMIESDVVSSPTEIPLNQIADIMYYNDTISMHNNSESTPIGSQVDDEGIVDTPETLNPNANTSSYTNPPTNSSGNAISGSNNTSMTSLDNTTNTSDNGNIVNSTHVEGSDRKLFEDTRFKARLEDGLYELVLDELNNEKHSDDDFILEDESNVIPFVDDAKTAAEEAEKAAEKAKEAADTDGDTQAAEAAGEAFEAAKKAAQATSEAAASAAIENLLSGDGSLVTAVLSTCFSNPVYGISQAPPNVIGKSGITTNFFLFVDGAHYFRANLTSPYIRVEPMVDYLPTPGYVPGGKGDAIDISLASFIIGGFLFGIVVMLHHIRVLNWDRRLQFKWFFHPKQEVIKRRGGYTNPVNTQPDDLTLEESIDVRSNLSPNIDNQIT